MELLTYLGFTAIGPFLGGMIANILSNRADSGLKQIESLIISKLQDGQLPANHDLQQAISDALRQALRGLVLALAASQHPASPFLREVRQQLLNPQDRKLPVTALFDVPFWTLLDSAERGWIDAFARCIENPETFSRLAGLGLTAKGGVVVLLAKNPSAVAGKRIHKAVKDWIDDELKGISGRPTMLNEFLRKGWPLADGERRINLFQAWRLFFRETIKEQPQVFNVYVAETLAELKQQLAVSRPNLAPALAKLPKADMNRFGDYLTAEFIELKHWLESRFDRLGQQLQGITQTQAEHTDLLQTIIGGFPALWRVHRWLRVGLANFALLVLAGLVFIVYQNQQNPKQTAAAVIQSFNANAVANRLRTGIEERFQQDKAQAMQAGQHWETLRELEKQREAALAKVDDVISNIQKGLADQPDPLFVTATRILQAEGADAALGYLASHRAERQARIARHKAEAEAADEKLKQDVQALFLESELRQIRGEWDPALAALREAVDISPNGWETRYYLGSLLWQTANYKEAQPQLQAALTLASNDAERGMVINSLASLYTILGAWADAEPLMRQSLGIIETNYGMEHPNVARVLNNLAYLLQTTNRLTEAETLVRRALIIDENNFGPSDPNVAQDIRLVPNASSGFNTIVQ